MPGRSEKSIQNEILLAIGSRPFLRIWRQNVGTARSMDGKRVIQFGGVPGAADLSGVLACGTRIEVEVKKTTGRQSEAQKRFQAVMERFGAVYFVARSVEEAEAKLDFHLERCKVCRSAVSTWDST